MKLTNLVSWLTTLKESIEKFYIKSHLNRVLIVNRGNTPC